METIESLKQELAKEREPRICFEIGANSMREQLRSKHPDVFEVGWELAQHFILKMMKEGLLRNVNLTILFHEDLLL